jgi:hypothetical protein
MHTMFLLIDKYRIYLLPELWEVPINHNVNYRLHHVDHSLMLNLLLLCMHFHISAWMIRVQYTIFRS